MADEPMQHGDTPAQALDGCSCLEERGGAGIPEPRRVLPGGPPDAGALR